ncbi:transcriptional regulator, TetR family [Aeromicrobium marinum DSM 15272]|uniref:Transcriptional regulator, TetR family n=1 Tax=Aeromicrobium marinum DSM 15272 TaxID=585531 RepID=E2S8V4_9ACTN|nr:TetR/AcrR family transcriptional regulator [Aeromicrobium marinum]EFQ84609.1 transcriptional regulator, TetR family [Aeromicrobium marinum DSM 15272]
MTPRRQQILDVAAELFAARGSRGVSMHDIGTACGISGPAIYKHFAGKDELLTHTLLDISQHLLTGGRERAGDLDALIGFHIEFALTHPALIVVQEREWSQLAPEGRAAVRRLQLDYIDVWVDALRARRPELDRATARSAVQATFGLLNSTPHSARIGDSAMRELLGRMARSGLLD